PPVLGIDFREGDCVSSIHEEIIKKISDNQSIDIVLIFGNFTGVLNSSKVTIFGKPTGLDYLRESMSKTVSSLRKFNKRIILIEDGPTFARDVTRNTISNLKRGFASNEFVSRVDLRNSRQGVKSLDAQVDTYVSTEDFFCKGDICPSVDENGKMVIYDQTHL